MSVTRNKPVKDAAANPAPAPVQAEMKENLETAGAWKIPAITIGLDPATLETPHEKPAPVVPQVGSNLDRAKLDQQFSELFDTAPIPVSPIAQLGATLADATENGAPAQPSEFTRMFASSNPPVTEAFSTQTPDAAPEKAGNISVAEPSEFTKMFQAPVETVTAKAPAAEKPVPAKIAPDKTGEFTRMFQAQPVTPQAPAPAAAAAKPQVRKTAEPGEFTRMFQSSSPAPVAPAQKPTGSPGEFTRMFQRGGESAKPAPLPSPTPLVSAPSEFTNFFQAPPPSGALPEMAQNSSPVPLHPIHAGDGKAGEFTRMFGQAEISGGMTAPPTMPAASTPAGSATETFQTPAAPAAPPAVSGPGEYTRMVSVPAELTLGQGNSPAPAPAANASLRMPEIPMPVMQAPVITPPVIQAPVVLQAPIIQAPVVQAPYVQAPVLQPPVISAPYVSAPVLQSPQIPQAQLPQTVPAKSNLPLILGLVGVILVAIAIVVFFAMAKR